MDCAKQRHAQLGVLILRLFPTIVQLILKDNITPGKLKRMFLDKTLNTALTDTDIGLMKLLPNMDDFTIEICYKILRFENLIGEPKCKWGNIPHETEIAIADDIQRILNASNEVITKTSEEITQMFSDSFEDNVKMIIERVDAYLDGDDCQQLYQHLHIQQISESELLAILEDIIQKHPIKVIPSVMTIDWKTNMRELYSRTAIVITDIFPDILRDLLRSTISPQDLYKKCDTNFLNSCFSDQKTYLKTLKLKNTFSFLDIPIIYKLLRYFSLISPPSKGWGKYPDPTDNLIADDVERIRTLRIQMAYSCDANIDKNTCDALFVSFSEIGKRIDIYFTGQTNYEQKVIDCRMCPMDIQMLTKYENAVKELENLKLHYKRKPINFYWGDTFEKHLMNLQTMFKHEKLEASSLLDSKTFYELLETGYYISYENRLYLGGPCNAGKTSFACILTGDKIPDKWISTNGLQVYFGQNGIHLKDKKIIPIRKDMLCHTVHGKVISAINEMHNKDATPNPNVNKVEKKETVEQPDKSAAKKTKISSKEKEKDTQIKIEEKDNPSSQILKPSGSSKTLNVLQEETLRKSILDEIRNGKYNLEIAPSDLVDFGGQKAFDMTHQLFILQEGTVLLLFDGSKDVNEPLPEYPGQIISSADILLHWVDSVSTYCTEESGMHRIQFVATHSDRYQDNFEIRRKELVTQLAATFQNHEKKLDLCFDNLFFIDARNKDDNEIDKLKDKLVQVAFSQKSWGKKMPLLWVPLEKQIIDLKLQGTSILRLEEIQKLNRLNEDLMMDDERLNFFLRTQHAIGKLIFFDQDELSKFVIIEPSVLVNALRSFVTDEMFFPANNTECHCILKKLQEDGMLKKNDLMMLWSQDEFQAIFKNQEFKDFLVKILLHLDVLVKPKLVNQEVNVHSEYYIIPCMIQTRLNNDYAEKYLNINKSICMAYDFKTQLVPPCVLFRLIASALGIWPLKVYKGRKMIFQDIATFVFDERNEFSIIMQGRKIITYFTNLNSIRNIRSPNVASVQECLTIAMISIFEFYQLNSRRIDALNREIFEKQFELEYGAACKQPCFVKKFEELRLSKDGMWECQHGQFHEVDYLLYWDSKQNQKNAQKIFKMTDTYISPTILMKKPPADLLRKVSFAVGIDGANLGSNLGIESTVIANMVMGKRYNIFEKTQRILGYWEMLCDPITIKQLVKALEKIGGRGLETIVDYYSSSNKPMRRGRSKSCPLLFSSHEYITENKGNNVLYKHTFSSDGFFVDCIVAKGINLRVKAEKDECSNRLIDCESVYHRHLLLQRRIDSRYYNSSKLREELTDAIQAKDSLLFRHILAYWNPLKSDITLLKQLLDLAIKNQCGCCAKAIAWQITRLFLKEVSVPECCDIWPGFRCACKFWNARHGEDSIYFCSPDVVIIVEVSAQVNECEPNSFYGIPIRYEKQISNSQEGKLITEKITSLQNQDPEWVSKVTGIDGSRAKHYFAQHRKLSVISPSPIKSQGYPIKQIIVKEPCIQLYCRLKGYIPVGEAHFPYEIDGIPTDILQGYAELLVEDIRIGSEVGRLGGKSGTLGGFVRYLGKDAFLTCAHVIIDKEYLVTKENRQKIHENTINVYYINQGSLPGTNALPCGELINFAFPPDESDGTTVDAAIIQLDKTCVKINPQNMVFDQNSIARSITDMGMSSEYLNKCCLDYKEVGTILELQMRSSGSVSGLQQCQDKIVIEKERRQELQTFIDSVSEMVIRNPKSDDISEFIHFKEQVKTVADGELKSPRVFTVYNQLSFRKIAFQLGDSGTCIYAVGPNGITGCIGMAIASHPAGGCIVTPIKAILSSFRML